MEKPAFIIEEGIRKYYDNDGKCIKQKAYNRLYKVTYKNEKENKKDDSKESK